MKLWEDGDSSVSFVDNMLDWFYSSVSFDGAEHQHTTASVPSSRASSSLDFGVLDDDGDDDDSLPPESQPDPEDVLFAARHPVKILDFGANFVVVPITKGSYIQFYPKKPSEPQNNWYYKVVVGDDNGSYTAYMTYDERYYDEPPAINSVDQHLYFNDIGARSYFFHNGGGTLRLPDHVVWAMRPFP